MSLSVNKIKHKYYKSNFLNKYVVLRKYDSYSCKIKEIWNHSGHENCVTWREDWAVTAALKYLTAGVKLKLSFSSENEAKNLAIAVQYLGQIEKKIGIAQTKVIKCFLSKIYLN